MMKDRLMKIPKLENFQYFLEITSLLHDLAQSEDQKLLSTITFDDDELDKNDRMNKINAYIHNNFSGKMTLEEAAKEVNMTPNAFNRFIKKRTNKTFVTYLHDVRIGYATRWLIEKDATISEVAFMCGFNNLSNFNRIFKEHVKRTPKEFKEFFSGRKTIV